ncbi:MAG: YceI family protein [Byssovorax sp.]
MPTCPAKHAVLIALLIAGAACTSRGGNEAPDAGRADAAPPPRIIPARVSAPGELLADVDSSKISLSIVKDGNTKFPVTAVVLLRDGRVTLGGPAPSARLSIDLTTFDSSMPLRNERVKQFFFETNNKNMETAELVIPSLPADAVAALQSARRASHVKLDGELTLHGQKKPIALVVDAAYEPGGTLVIRSSAPIDLNVNDYGMIDNLRRLSLICKHDSIEEIIKVEATIELPVK